MTELLQPLVREWGKEAVLRAVGELGADDSHVSDETPENAIGSGEGKRVQKKKPSAVHLVSKMDQPSSRRDLLMMIAAKYDNRRFLPHVSDVREFLVMRGEARRAIKDRSEGFRLFLEATKELPFEQLQHFATDSIFSGPAELAPLSDAIGAAGKNRRQYVESADQTPLSSPGHDSPNDET